MQLSAQACRPPPQQCACCCVTCVFIRPHTLTKYDAFGRRNIRRLRSHDCAGRAVLRSSHWVCARHRPGSHTDPLADLHLPGRCDVLVLECFALIYPLNLGWLKSPSVDTAVRQRQGGEPGQVWLVDSSGPLRVQNLVVHQKNKKKKKREKSLMRPAHCVLSLREKNPVDSTNKTAVLFAMSGFCQRTWNGAGRWDDFYFFWRRLWPLQRPHFFCFLWMTKKIFKKINSCTFLLCFWLAWKRPFLCLCRHWALRVVGLVGGAPGEGGYRTRGLLHRFLSQPAEGDDIYTMEDLCLQER